MGMMLWRAGTWLPGAEGGSGGWGHGDGSVGGTRSPTTSGATSTHNKPACRCPTPYLCLLAAQPRHNLHNLHNHHN
eukprot:251424-Chlamydomonas_euryale.AAC.1